jgi:hypothetical protein
MGPRPILFGSDDSLRGGRRRRTIAFMITKKERDDALRFGQTTSYDNARTAKAGQAYFLAQVIDEVDRAFGGLVRDFRAGRFDPGGWPMAKEFRRLVGEARDRPADRSEYEQLETAFADGGVEQNVDALADALDAFETSRNQAPSSLAPAARIALQHQVERFRADLTQRGDPGLGYAVDTLWQRVGDTLALLCSNQVRRHVGDGRAADPALVIATLGGEPLSEVRARGNRGNVVRQLSQSLLTIDLDNWSPGTTDQQLADACAPVVDWPRETPPHEATTADGKVVDEDEVNLIRIRRRDASWRTMS